MDWNPSTIRELVGQVGEIASEVHLQSVTLPTADGPIVLSFYVPPPPPPPPPVPLTAQEEAELRFKRAKAEIELQYGHTGHVPSQQEVLDWMSQRGTV